jgi:hypothetical protein
VFSAFNLPLTKLIGINNTVPGDWSLADAAAAGRHRFAIEAN